jgi:hypothetical protein
MTIRRGIPLLLLAAVLATLPVPSRAAGSEVVVTEEVQLRVADAFLSEGEYYRAITEYKKFLEGTGRKKVLEGCLEEVAAGGPVLPAGAAPRVPVRPVPGNSRLSLRYCRARICRA